MAVSQPLKLGDALREALRDAQQVLDQFQLTGKVKLVPETGGAGGLAGVESSMDRTAKDAKDAADKSITGSDATGPLSPNDRLVEAMTRLMRAMEGVADGLGKGPGRRRHGGGASTAIPDEPEDGAGGGGYVNPYILQGLLQNPLGTARSSFTSMLMGGAGSGIKAPGWLMNMLAGSGGTFSPGRALAAPLSEAGAFASAGAIGTSTVAVPIAAFAGTMALQNSMAKDNLQDSTDVISDIRMSRGMGFDWRAGAWNGRNQSRQDIWGRDAHAVVTSAGVGFGGLRRTLGDVGVVNQLNEAAEAALRMGVDPSHMGSVIGAGVRSGTLNLNGSDAPAQMTRYLALIEQWTSRTAEHGLSANEALQRLAEVSQRGMVGTNVLTAGAQVSMLSMDERIRSRLPSELAREGVKGVTGALEAAPQGEMQTVMMMNQVLGPDGNLTPEGEAMAQKAFGSYEVQEMKAQYGGMAGTLIAQRLTQSGYGRGQMRMGLYRGSGGMNGVQAQMAFGSGDILNDAMARSFAMSPHAGEDVGGLHAPVKGRDAVYPGNQSELENEKSVARLGQVVTRLTGVTAESSEALLRLNQSFDRAARAIVETTDRMRMTGGESATDLLNPLGTVIDFHKRVFHGLAGDR